MFLGNLKKLKSSRFSFNKLLFFSYLTLILINKLNVLSQPITKQNLDEESTISNISFVTKAVKKTGNSVVTIDTQKFVKNKQFSRD